MPMISDPTCPALLPLPGLYPATTASWRRLFLIFRQLSVLTPGAYFESSRLATTPSMPLACETARTAWKSSPGNDGGVCQYRPDSASDSSSARRSRYSTSSSGRPFSCSRSNTR
jgi:hypothetical protein